MSRGSESRPRRLTSGKQTAESPDMELDEGTSWIPLSWEVVSESDIQSWLDIGGDVNMTIGAIGETLGLDGAGSDLLDSIVLDFYYTAFLMATQAGSFGPTQLSSLVTLCQHLLERAREQQPLGKVMAWFRHTLLSHTERGAGDLDDDIGGGDDGEEQGEFDQHQASAIAEFFNRTILRHWRLYTHAMVTTQEEESGEEYRNVEVPESMPVPRLEDMMPYDVWEELDKQRRDREREEAERAAEEAKRLAEEATTNVDVIERVLDALPLEKVREVTESVVSDFMNNLEAEVSAQMSEQSAALESQIQRLGRAAAASTE